MKIFFVRHGEGASTKEEWQSPNTPLSRLGEKQSRTFINISRLKLVDVILTSKWERARETAEIIGHNLGKPVEVIESIHEREQHPKIYGGSRNSDLSIKYQKEFLENFRNLDWKFEGIEESLRDVIRRAIKFKEHLLDKHIKQNLLVVSHDIFIRCFITICTLGEKYDDRMFTLIFYALRISNASISLIEYQNKLKHWVIWYLNGFSHLKVIKKD